MTLHGSVVLIRFEFIKKTKKIIEKQPTTTNKRSTINTSLSIQQLAYIPLTNKAKLVLKQEAKRHSLSYI